MTNIIKSIQAVSISLAANANSNTATINTVTTANAAIFWNGFNTAYTGIDTRFWGVNVTLTNATTVTVTRGGNTTSDSMTVNATVVEFQSSVVNSIQYGSVSISASTSGTTTLGTSVGSNAFIIYNGQITSTISQNYAAYCNVSLNQATGVVTANAAASSTVTAYFCVVDLTSTAIASVQQVNFAPGATTATSGTSGITTVTTADTILVNGGTWNGSFGGYNACSYEAVLTNATTITFTRNGVNSSSPNLIVTAVQFQSGVLTANAVQRGTIALTSAQTSNTAGITGVNTSFALCNYCGFKSAAVSRLDEGTQALVLTNTTTVTNSVNTAAVANTASFEVIEFVSGSTTWTGTSTWPGVGTLVEGHESQIDVASAILGGVGTLVEAHEAAIQSALATLGGVGTWNSNAVAPGGNATLPGIGTLIEGGESQIDAAFATLGGLGSFTAIAVPGVTTVSGGAADEVDPQTERRRRWLAEHDRELPRVRVVRQDKPQEPQVAPESETQEAPQAVTEPEAPPPGAGRQGLPATPFIAPALSLLSSPALGLIRAIKGRDNPPDAVSVAPLPPPPPPTFSLRLSAIAAERAAQRQRDDEDDVAAVLGMM